MITDRQVAPSKSQSSGPTKSCLPPPESQVCGSDRDSLFQTRYEERYDVYDRDYVSWLQQNHPESLPAHFKPSTTAATAISSDGDATCSTSGDASECWIMRLMYFCCYIIEGILPYICSAQSVDLHYLGIPRMDAIL